MQSFALVYLLLLLVCYSSQIPQFENCTADFMKKIDTKKCVNIKCFTDTVAFEIQNCDFIRCLNGAQIGYHTGNDSEEYPKCCSYPVCQC